ncbi:MAG: DNA polymerase III subunit alpha, partial [Bdellovibrionales bacterium]|nr:DNA polymerase III subunit alpha [Bdellovibrionales bacterium]
DSRKAHSGKGFESLEDFFSSIDLRRVNKKTVECLIKAGAFDGFGANRAELTDNYPRFIERADQAKRDSEMGQVSLFAFADEVQEQEKVRIESRPPWGRSERLIHEKEVLGFYLSDHPLVGLDKLVQKWTKGSLQEFVDKANKTQVCVLGLVSSMREIITKKGTRMAFAVLEDLTGTAELVIFPDPFGKYESLLRSDLALLVSGTLEKEQGVYKILVDEIRSVYDVLAQAKSMVLKLRPQSVDRLSRLQELLTQHPGETSLSLELSLPDLSKSVQLESLAPRTVKASQKLMENLGALMGQDLGVSFQ